MSLITGLHHITAVCSSAQDNINFYSGVLGLRLVKKTVNFDGPDVYHFYYGDDEGNPGNILTFFPYQGLVNGRQGKGMLNTTSFSVPYTSLNYWQERFKHFGVLYKSPKERFENELIIYFEDKDGLGLELVFNEQDQRRGISGGTVPAEHAIRGIYNVEAWLDSYERTAGLMTEQLNHNIISESGNRLRLAVADQPGYYIDLLQMPEAMRSLAGSGTVHHLAFCVKDFHALGQIRAKILKTSLDPTPFRDRKYFHSIYFREPGGLLFEIATAGPGFLIDEKAIDLGSSLQLPADFEKDRLKIEKALPPVALDQNFYKL